MTIYALESPGNFVLGAGYLFAKKSGEAHWSYLAETPGITIAVESETVELESSDSPTAELLEEVISKITRTGTTAIRNIDSSSLSMFFAATVETDTQAQVVAETEDFTSVKLGKWYQLGSDTTLVPTPPEYGYRGVSSVSIVEDPGGAAVALVLDTDYEIDVEEGMFRLLSTAANVAEGDTIRVTYTVDASTTEVVKTGANASNEFALKFVGDNTKGENRTVFMPKCDLGPNGEFALKSRDTFQETPLQFRILNPSDGSSALYITTKPELS